MTTIPRPDEQAREQALTLQSRLTKPTGALGRLEPLSAWASAVQGTCPPRRFTAPAVAIFAGDHAVARMAGTSAYPPEVTAQMVLNFLAGGAAVNVLARMAGARVEVVDVSVDADPGYADALRGSVAARRVRRGSGSIDREDAMSPGECAAALGLGKDIADLLIDEGADLLIPGDMGIGNTTPAAALISVLAGVSPAEATGRGTGVDDEGLARKRTAVEAAVGRVAVYAHPDELLSRIGSPDIAAMSGFLEQAARRRTPVMLDGVVSCAAALVAEQRSPGAVHWWAAGHRSTEPAASAALARLDLEPLVDLGLRLGEGTGALLALPLLEAAILTLGEMATFDSAGVSDKGE